LFEDTTLKEIRDAIDKLAQLTKEQIKWTKLAGMQQLRSILERNLLTDEMRKVYQLSDGQRTTRDIAKLSGIGSNATIATYWSKWKTLGIVEPSNSFKGRYQRIIGLDEVGIEVPRIVGDPQIVNPESAESIDQ